MSENWMPIANERMHATQFSALARIPNWFAVYTTPRHEKHVSDMLAERHVETFLPLYRTNRQWKKSRPVSLELPLFPSYVFVRIERGARGAVLGTPGVL